MKIVIYNNNFEKAIRKFKKTISTSGLLQEIREREHFEKPSEVRRKAKKQAVQRWRKKQREMNETKF